MRTMFIPGRSLRLAGGLLGLLLLALTGCAHLPTSAPLPPGITVTAVTRIDRGAPFVWAPGGERIALGRGGLRLLDLAGGTELKIWDESPVDLAWSPDGSRLAAAFPREGKTTLRLFDPANGAVMAEAVVAGRVSGLGWGGAGELLAAAVDITTYSFGGNFRQLLYRWSGTDSPVAATLAETTVKPLTLRQWGEALYRVFHLTVSPAGDELIYTRLHDPPALLPYLQVVLRHQATGAEREVATVGLESGGALFIGDVVVYGDGRGGIRRVDPWQVRELASFPAPGVNLAISPGGSHLLADGRLYRDGNELAVFPAESSGLFAPRGDRLLVRNGSTLFLLAGLPADEAAPPGMAVRERLLLLRKWRSQGLISADEYRAAKERILKE